MEEAQCTSRPTLKTIELRLMNLIVEVHSQILTLVYNTRFESYWLILDTLFSGRQATECRLVGENVIYPHSPVILGPHAK